MVLKRPDGDQDKKMSDIDKINLLRSGSGEEPEPAIEFSECKAKKCNPGNASSSYTIDPNEHVHAVTDSLSFAYKNAMKTEADAGAGAPDAGAGAGAGAPDAGAGAGAGAPDAADAGAPDAADAGADAEATIMDNL